MREYRTPEGKVYRLFQSMLREHHLLIAGCTGSGKSVLENGLIHTALYDSPAKARFIFIDPKLTELVDYKELPHTLAYADNAKDIKAALQYALQLMKNRQADNQRKRIKEYDGSTVYVIIDELQDLMTTNRKDCFPIIQRIAQVGRSSKIKLLCCTQSPISKIIPTELKCNFSARVGLKTISRQDSRNILDMPGCESLPDPEIEGKAYGYYRHSGSIDLYQIPMIEQSEQKRIIDYWMNYKPRKWLFA